MVLDTRIEFHKHRLLNAAKVYRCEAKHLQLDLYSRDLLQSGYLMSKWNSLNKESERVFHRASSSLHKNGVQISEASTHVLCIIPTLLNHPYLSQALEAISKQSRLPDEVVIALDDTTDDNQVARVEVLIQQSCLADICSSVVPFSGLNGPYKLLNSIVDNAQHATHIWLHDSDDISHPSRLEKQLEFMNRYKLDICGTFEIRLERQYVDFVQFPVNASRALMTEPGHCMLWPSSLIRRSLWQRLGGCSDLHRFGADTEFQLRAAFIGRMGNYPAFLYARRKHDASLTSSPETGLGSWARGYLNSMFKADYYKRQLLKEQGVGLSLMPRYRQRHSGIIASIEEEHL